MRSKSKKEKTLLNVSSSFLRKTRNDDERFPSWDGGAVAITINTGAHLPGSHDGYSRDGHRSQCLSV